MKWQEDVLKSDLKFTIARASRQSGKTFTAIQWAREQRGKRVLFYTRNAQQSQLIARAMVGMYEEEITNYRTQGDMRIFFTDGTTIFFTSSNNNRGLMIESLVVDDVPGFDRRAYAAINPLGVKHTLMIGTEICSFGQQLIEETRGKVNIIVCDYIDLLKEGFFKLDQIHEIQEEYSTDQFIKEFGPWNRPMQPTNEDFLYLLQQ